MGRGKPSGHASFTRELRAELGAVGKGEKDERKAFQAA